MFNFGKELVRTVARALLGDYAAYRVYVSPEACIASSQQELEANIIVREIDETAIHSSPEPLIREQAPYLGSESHAYALFVDDHIAGVCIYWYRGRYRKRNFWPLDDDEAKLVQIVSVPTMRGRGIATTLIRSSCHDMMERGFRRAYARIWHSNTPSLRAFERAGWTKIALVIEINPLRRQRAIRMRFDSTSRRPRDIPEAIGTRGSR